MLQNEIDRLTLSSENVKTAKNNINREIVLKGGIEANTISEIPAKLESMVKSNFKKVAIFYPEWSEKIYGSSSERETTITIPLNIPTNFKKFFVVIKDDHNTRFVATQGQELKKYKDYVDNTAKFYINTWASFMNLSLESITNKDLKIKYIVDESYGTTLSIEKIIAIE